MQAIDDRESRLRMAFRRLENKEGTHDRSFNKKKKFGNRIVSTGYHRLVKLELVGLWSNHFAVTLVKQKNLILTRIIHNFAAT